MNALHSLPEEVVRSRTELLQHRPMVVAVLAKAGLVSSADGEDRVQEVWARALTTLPRFEPGKGAMGRWIAAVAHNVAVDEARARHYRGRTFADQPDEIETAPDRAPSPERQIAVKRVYERLLVALDKLPANERVVFDLHVSEGLPHAEIGVRLSISEDASKMRYARAKKQLMALVPELEDIIAAVLPPAVTFTPATARLYDTTMPIALLLGLLVVASLAGIHFTIPEAARFPRLPTLQWQPIAPPVTAEEPTPPFFAPNPSRPASARPRSLSSTNIARPARPLIRTNPLGQFEQR